MRSATPTGLRRRADPQESDIDLVFLNWRGVLAPPDISEERTDELIGYLEKMHDTEGWQQALEENGWTDDFKTGDDFATFIEEQDATGLRDPRGAGAAVSDDTPSRARSRRTVDKAQYGLAAALLVVGVYTIVDARGLNVGFGDPIGPRVFPYVIGTGMVVLAVLLAIATARGDVAEGEEGEDVDLTIAGRLDRPSASWSAILVLNMLLVNLLGWAITGALLFAGAAWALGSRTLVRDLIVGAVLSVASWYFF